MSYSVLSIETSAGFVLREYSKKATYVCTLRPLTTLIQTPSALIPAHYGGVVGRWGIEEIVRREEERKEGRRRWGGEGEERR